MTTNTDVDTESLGLPPIYQVGYIVRDVDATVRNLGPIFGPFTVFESDEEVAYRGVPTRAHLKIAIGHSGDTEFEFIEVVSGDSPHKAWLDEHGECVMHVAFKVDDVDAECARLADLGFELEWRGDVPGTDIVYAYVRGNEEVGGHYLELTQGF